MPASSPQLLVFAGALLLGGGVLALGWDRAQAEAPCLERAAGLERDACLRDTILAAPADDVARVIGLASVTSDPVVRDATLMTWVMRNRPALSSDAALRVCGRLSTTEARACERKVLSPHLWP